VSANNDYNRSYYQGQYSGKGLLSDVLFSFNETYYKLKGGLNLSYDKMNQEDYYYYFNPFDSSYYEINSNLASIKPSNYVYSAYAQAEFHGGLIARKLDNLSCMVGGRFVQGEKFNPEFTFEFNPSYRVSKKSLFYFSYTTGYNIPSLYQQYAPSVSFVDPSLTLGNKNLNPEKSQALELGFRCRVNEKIDVSLASFINSTDEMIDYVYLWNGDVPVDSLAWFDYVGDRYLNIGNQTAYGAELEVDVKLNSRFSFKLNLTLVDGNIEFSNSSIDTLQTGGNHVQIFNSGVFVIENVKVDGLVRRPSTANIGLNYIIGKRALLMLNAQYINNRNDVYYDYSVKPIGALATQQVDSYFLLGANIKYDIIPKLSIIGKVDNILNADYQEIYGYTTKGRSFYLSLNYRLK
jgi:vitamin B12 transporter